MTDWLIEDCINRLSLTPEQANRLSANTYIPIALEGANLQVSLKRLGFPKGRGFLPFGGKCELASRLAIQTRICRSHSNQNSSSSLASGIDTLLSNIGVTYNNNGE